MQGRPFHAQVFVVVLLLAMSTSSVNGMQKAPSCNVMWQLLSARTGPLSLFPFAAVSLDLRRMTSGTYYIAYSSDNPARPSISRVMSYDLGASGLPGAHNRDVNLAGTNAPVVPGNSPVAQGSWILYDFGQAPGMATVPLIAYGLGADAIPGTADDVGVAPVFPDHVPGPQLKDVAGQSMIYVLSFPDINRTGINNNAVILQTMGQNGRPDFPPGTGDDTFTTVAHLANIVPGALVNEVRTSSTGKFAVVLDDGTLEFYDLGVNGVYENANNPSGDDAWITVLSSSRHVTESDLSPDGRYLAYTYTVTGNPTVFVGVIDVGPDGRMNTADDATATFGPAFSQPRIDGFDPNVPASGRLVYVAPYFLGSALYYVNSGPDGRFATFDDIRQLVPLPSNVVIISSLHIAGNLIAWEGVSMSSTAIQAYRPCI